MDNENLTNENTPISASDNPENQVEEIQNQSEEIIADKPATETNTEEAHEVKSEELQAETKTEDAPEAKTDGVATETNTEEENKVTVNRFKKYAEIYDELTKKNETKERIEVEVNDRIRGGLRVIYKNVPLFLPTSHFSLKRNPPEEMLTKSIGKKFTVEVHEVQEYDEGRKAVIVSRKNQLIDEFWDNIHVGDIVEGRVSSIAPFGVFLDLGGIEALIHISRLSYTHVDDPAKFVKKGDVLKAKVVELNREKNRIALNHKELETSPWDNVEEDFPADSIHKGIVKRITDFGAYIELKPGVDGLLRTQEMSWTKRIKHPSDILKANQEIQVKVLSSSSEKRSIALSYKQATENPWPAISEKFPLNSEFEGKVFQVIPQGMIVTLNDEIDGFMPRSKMKRILQSNKIPYTAGDTIKVKIVDLVNDEESLILAPVVNDDEIKIRHNKRKPKEDSAPKTKDTGISLADMIPEDTKKGLIDSL